MSTEITRREFDDHLKISGDNFCEIKTDIKSIKENHLTHIQEFMYEMKQELTKQTTNLTWLTRFFWIFMTAIISGLVGIFFAVIKYAS